MTVEIEWGSLIPQLRHLFAQPMRKFITWSPFVGLAPLTFWKVTDATVERISSIRSDFGEQLDKTQSTFAPLEILLLYLM
jgi:hypothetical protein